ncbi:MAG: thioredoxin family protein [Nocardioides sp.]
MTTGQWVLLVAVVAALGLGAYRAWADGRFRGTHGVRGAEAPVSETPASEAPASEASSPGAAEAPGGPVNVLDGTSYADALGERATLLQFSSAFCAPCRVTRHTLADVAARLPGVAHVEVDAEHHLDLVRRLQVMRTPTTLVLDAQGRESTRAAGAPRREQVLSALGFVVENADLE